MKIVQSTWVRYHHFDLARELNAMGYLERIFTSLPWWKASEEAQAQAIPREKISCNFLLQGLRRVASKSKLYTQSMDGKLAVEETKFFSKWVANNMPDCDAYMGISGSGLHAGKLVKSRGGIYIMDRGSTHIRHADLILKDEYSKWGLERTPINPWLIENEEQEAFEANVITVPSDFVKKTFVNQGISESKVRVVPYGVSLSEFYSVGNPSSEVFSLLFVGQVSIRKGFLYLLQAFKEFNHPNKKLIVVGGVQDELKSLIDKIGTTDVEFVGTVARSSVKQYMSIAHALVLPSLEEGLALVQLQAMACGCPIIATPNTGSETLFEHGKHGLIVDVASTEALVMAFTQLADQPELRKLMSSNCIEQVRNKNGWNEYSKKVIEIVNEK